MTLTCLGAARTVTGSKHLLDAAGHRILVDCGLFQGLKELRQRNWQALPVPATSIETVVLTHAHLDHCGALPRLVSQGFRGRIFCTAATADLARIVLADAAKLQEEDAERANRKGYTRHQPALPLFTSQEAARAMTMLQPVGYNRPMPVVPGLTVEFVNAGHLLGAAGAVEAIFCVLAMRDSVIPPTLNLDNPSFETPINLTPKTAVKKKVRAALSNSFGFGGTNAALVLKQAS